MSTAISQLLAQSCVLLRGGENGEVKRETNDRNQKWPRMTNKQTTNTHAHTGAHTTLNSQTFSTSVRRHCRTTLCCLGKRRRRLWDRKDWNRRAEMLRAGAWRRRRQTRRTRTAAAIPSTLPPRKPSSRMPRRRRPEWSRTPTAGRPWTPSRRASVEVCPPLPPPPPARDPETVCPQLARLAVLPRRKAGSASAPPSSAEVDRSGGSALTPPWILRPLWPLR